MKIELYCPKSETGSALKSKLEQALAAHDLDYRIMEINESGEFLKAGAFSLPVIRVLNKLIVHNEESSIDNTVKAVIDNLLSEHRHYILVPVDFTPESVHALRYAQVIASTLKMGITIAHIHEPIIDTGIVGDFDGEMREIHCNKLEQMMSEINWDQIHSGKYVPVDTHFDVGDVKSHIVNLVAEDKYNLILMSTKAENTFLKRMQGSVSTTIALHSPKPVMVIPIETPLKFPEKLTVGVTDELFTDHVLEYVLDFSATQNVILDFVHIGNDLTQYNRLEEVLSDKLAKLNKSQVAHHITRVRIGEEHIASKLLDFAENTKADMIVLATHNRNFIESLGYRSTTKEILLHPVLPIMILHGHQPKASPRANFVYEAIR